MDLLLTVPVGTSEAGGVLGRVGAGICEATGCCDSGCGADNASVLKIVTKNYVRQRKTMTKYNLNKVISYCEHLFYHFQSKILPCPI